MKDQENGTNFKTCCQTFQSHKWPIIGGASLLILILIIIGLFCHRRYEGERFMMDRMMDGGFGRGEMGRQMDKREYLRMGFDQENSGPRKEGVMRKRFLSTGEQEQFEQTKQKYADANKKLQDLNESFFSIIHQSMITNSGDTQDNSDLIKKIDELKISIQSIK